MRQKLWYHIMTGLGFLLLLGATLFVALRWREIPDEVALHYDFLGNPTDWSGKGSLLGLLVLSWVMYAVLAVVSFFPQTWNTPGRPAIRVSMLGAKPQSPRQLQAAADMLALMRVEMAALFSWLMLCTARGTGLGAWFLPGFSAALGLTLVIGMVRMVRT